MAGAQSMLRKELETRTGRKTEMLPKRSQAETDTLTVFSKQY